MSENGASLAAAIAADRDDRHLFAGGRVGERVDPFGDEVVKHPDQLIDQKALLADRARRRCRRPRSGGGSRRVPRASAAFSGGSNAPRSSAERRRVGDRLRQLLGERPPVDDVALPQDVGHQPLLQMPPGVDADDRAGGMGQMGDAGDHRQRHVLGFDRALQRRRHRRLAPSSPRCGRGRNRYGPCRVRRRRRGSPGRAPAPAPCSSC